MASVTAREFYLLKDTPVYKAGTSIGIELEGAGRVLSADEALAALAMRHHLAHRLAATEAALIGAAREAGATWEELAPALRVCDRRAAHRHFMRLSEPREGGHPERLAADVTGRAAQHCGRGHGHGLDLRGRRRVGRSGGVDRAATPTSKSSAAHSSSTPDPGQIGFFLGWTGGAPQRASVGDGEGQAAERAMHPAG
ncbi:hypothetical protein [Actinomadura mexicana]|uniref:Uncharacterized protein n=1 Tax=Actinomadura mexicana TaxID=134959 RepID=A0A238UMS6_9ACTN|nr:hypothetical protein [Actinomadura mexicana]SNR22957.1 hypothetical protein SAMN06265355_10175 [Actinomadura mexicana]